MSLKAPRFWLVTGGVLIAVGQLIWLAQGPCFGFSCFEAKIVDNVSPPHPEGPKVRRTWVRSLDDGNEFHVVIPRGDERSYSDEIVVVAPGSLSDPTVVGGIRGDVANLLQRSYLALLSTIAGVMSMIVSLALKLRSRIR